MDPVTGRSNAVISSVTGAKGPWTNVLVASIVLILPEEVGSWLMTGPDGGGPGLPGCAREFLAAAAGLAGGVRRLRADGGAGLGCGRRLRDAPLRAGVRVPQHQPERDSSPDREDQC